MEGDEDRVFHCFQMLSHEELERVSRFRFAAGRRRFAISHSAVREILAYYVGVAPKDLELSRLPSGKPSITSNNSCGVQFNVSHSGDVALLAVAEGIEVGVDIEVINAGLVTNELVSSVLATNERRIFNELTPDARSSFFYTVWTTKEAFLKALGCGLSYPMRELDTVAQQPVHLYSHWRQYTVPSRCEHKAALVVQGKQHKLHFFSFGHSVLTANGSPAQLY